ncbi:MAG: hypothetical protein R6U22_08200 [Desulfohalobiaceae bacterium]
MGYGQLDPAVVDAGPAIHLQEIDCLLFLKMFQTLHIPDAVWNETVKQNHISQKNLNRVNNIERHTVDNIRLTEFVEKECLSHLDHGELECLYLCKTLKTRCILTDDLAVRDATKKLNLLPVGSLGIVVKAFHKGIISLTEARNNLYLLHERSTLFVTKTIVDIAISHLSD